MASSAFEGELFLEVDRHYSSGDFEEESEDPLLVYGVLRAVVEEDLWKVRHFIALGKSVNVNDTCGNTPLHVAVLKKKVEFEQYAQSI
ncbi:hypothetical protein JTB14_024427 [Gonioctena quinquepunctata]|nr:hypothetical protein JTB14_024427 [Gonioctena quinquepunctata]